MMNIASIWIAGNSSFLRSNPRLMRLTLLLAICLSFLLLANGAFAEGDIKIPLATDLEDDSRLSNSSGAIIVLYFSAQDCRYCMRLEEAVLKPLLRSGDYDGRVLLRKVDWRSESTLADFSGRNVSLRALSERYDVKVTPTLVFVDQRGREAAPRILGFQSADFFWYYFDQRIKKSPMAKGG